MKKLFTTMLGLALILSISVLASCRGGETNAAADNASMKPIVEKFEAGEQLTEAEYSTVLDYVDAAVDEAAPLSEEFKEAYESGNETKMDDVQKKGEELEAKYEYMNDALKILYAANEEDAGEANVEKGKKIYEKMQKVGLNF
ncbi:MAG: hypothetical protein HDS52_02355 [Barnesiella sp.]|nr:hypothetical protein [Barnesiella sp.]